MEYKELSNGCRIPVIGMGTWGIGGRFEADTSNEKGDINIIKKAIELGFTHIDTAEIYGNGQTEKEIGIAIKDFDRKKLFITTKVWKSNLRYDDVINSLEKSLGRLRTDYVDLYLIHWPNPAIPISETMRAMEKLIRDREVRAIGVSNFSLQEMKEAQKHLKRYRVVASQVEYNLLSREPEKEIIPFCVKNNIVVIAYRPLAKGSLLDKDIKQLKDVAKKYNKTRSQVALNWVISHNEVVAITKSTNVEHLKENIGAIGWKLKAADKEKIETIKS